MKNLSFSWGDYVLFVLMLSLSILVGIYYGCFGKNQQTTADYLLGGKQMKVLPVALSLVASSISGISLLGMPAEIYLYGTQFMMLSVAIMLMGLMVNFIYLPVLWNSQITTVFEYLELRFDRSLRVFASVLFTISSLVMLPTIIYAPSLAFSQVTGFDLHWTAVFMCSICLFYTTIGGLKAVVSADTLQYCVTLSTLGCVFVMGIVSVGGFGAIWEKAQFGNRIEFFNMNPDPTIRMTFWGVVVGGGFNWTAFTGINPATTQRFLAVSTLKDSKRVLAIYLALLVVSTVICCFSGLIMYAKYYDCDPLSAGYMKRPDQILPFYVLEVAAQISGLSGLFIAGLFSTSLSSLSTILTSLSGIFYTAFVAPFMPTETSDKRASYVMKLITVVIGCISVALIFVVERLGTIMELVGSFNGLTMGPLLGLFTLGMLFPIANKKGALIGVSSSLLLMTVVIVKYQTLVWNGTIKHKKKPFYTFGCNATFDTLSEISITTTSPLLGPANEAFWLFRIAFFYYILMGTLTTLIVGLLASWVTQKSTRVPVNLDLLSPYVHRFVPGSGPTESVEKEFHVFKIVPKVDDNETEESAEGFLDNDQNKCVWT